MITPLRPPLVSLVTILSLAIAACARVQPAVMGDDAVAPQSRPTIVFDNAANDYVDVYLTAEQRQWRLGRVAPGAKTTFRLPVDELPAASRNANFVQLVVLAGSPLSLQAARDPRAVTTIAQPVAQLLQQDWTFAHAQSMSPQILGARASNRRQ